MSETIDLVDSNGNIVRYGIRRDDTASYDGLYMQIVIVVVRNSQGHVLVQQRAHTKSVNGGDIDHVCGAVASREKPQKAAVREALQETGVRLRNLYIVRRGINPYGRYCYLMRASSDDLPARNLNPREVEWAAYHEVDGLHAWHKSGEFTFVKGFFEDLQHVLGAQ